MKTHLELATLEDQASRLIGQLHKVKAHRQASSLADILGNYRRGRLGEMQLSHAIMRGADSLRDFEETLPVA